MRIYFRDNVDDQGGKEIRPEIATITKVYDMGNGLGFEVHFDGRMPTCAEILYAQDDARSFLKDVGVKREELEGKKVRAYNIDNTVLVGLSALPKDDSQSP